MRCLTLTHQTTCNAACSYATFQYGPVNVVQGAPGSGAMVRLTVTHAGPHDVVADEVVLLFATPMPTHDDAAHTDKAVAASAPPRQNLIGVSRLRAVTSGESRTVEFSLSARDLLLADASGAWLDSCWSLHVGVPTGGAYRPNAGKVCSCLGGT